MTAEYEVLKRQLAREHRFDREAYTEAKRPFIDRITDIAMNAGRVIEPSQLKKLR